MTNEIEESRYNFKGLFKYISTVVSWTVFVILILICIFLVYYYISVRLYATKGEKYEPKFSIYTIVSPSMEPTINKYDVIVNTRVDNIEDVKVNDVITFISTWKVTYGMTITHRVVGIKEMDNGEVCLVTRGDNNTQEDSACVTEKDIIGVTRAVIPGLGKIQSVLASKMGWLLIIIVPALYIIIKDIFKIFGLAKEIKEEEKEGKNASNKNSEKNKNNMPNRELKNAYRDLMKVKNKKS